LCCADRAVTIEGDKARLEEVLIMLLKNAMEAAEGSNRRAQAEIVLRKEGRDAVIELEDNGPGVEAPHLIQIFDPFFSTHPDSQTRGHGLPRAFNLLRHMDGGLSVYNSEGGGAVARIQLPLARA
jgi:two-component system C4-dicarboxylate transport sensor histidine kinase DctB